MVALAIGPAMAKDIQDILESMFAVGLRFVNNCSTNVCAKYRILLASSLFYGLYLDLETKIASL